MGGKSAEVVNVAGQHRTTRLRQSHHHGIHRGTASRSGPYEGRTSCSALRQPNLDVACLQEAIGTGVGSWVAAQAFNEDDAWDQRRPQSPLLECHYQRRGPCRTLGQPAHTTAVEDEQIARRLAGLSGLVLADPSSNGLGFGKLGSRRLPDLGHEIRQICVGLLRQLLAP
jgi:hypothetical protein